MTAKELEQKLAQYGAPIVDVTVELVTFEDKDGRIKDAPISGLKDRLSRARKFLKGKL